MFNPSGVALGPDGSIYIADASNERIRKVIAPLPGFQLSDFFIAAADGIEATHALIRSLPWSSRSSQTPGLQKNADGSADIYFGPEAPAGKESNWVPTSADGKFEVLFRLYGPEKPLSDKTWQLPDIEKIKLSEGRTGGVKLVPICNRTR